jgi:hypothetical protein
MKLHLRDETGAQSSTITPSLSDFEEDPRRHSEERMPCISSGESHESSSLMCKPPASGSGPHSGQTSLDLPDREFGVPHLDMRGFALLPHIEFWQLFSMLGLMTGIGLMTIK